MVTVELFLYFLQIELHFILIAIMVVISYLYIYAQYQSWYRYCIFDYFPPFFPLPVCVCDIIIDSNQNLCKFRVQQYLSAYAQHIYYFCSYLFQFINTYGISFLLYSSIYVSVLRLSAYYYCAISLLSTLFCTTESSVRIANGSDLIPDFCFLSVFFFYFHIYSYP